MSIIDIPDKICPHCGGTRWSIRKEKIKDEIKYRYRCPSQENESKKRRIEKIPNFYKDLYKRRGKELRNKYVSRGYFQSEKYKNRESKRVKKQRDNLTDTYIKSLILNDINRLVINASEIPLNLVELKRKQIQLYRQLKQNAE